MTTQHASSGTSPDTALDAWIAHLRATADQPCDDWADALLARRHQTPPWWLDLCARATVRLEDAAACDRLLAATAPLDHWARLPDAEAAADPWHEPPAAQVHRCGAMVMRGLQAQATVGEPPPGLDLVSLALRDTWLRDAAAQALHGGSATRWQPPPAAPGLRDVSIPVLLVTQHFSAHGGVQRLGVQALLTLRTVAAPGACLRLVAAPASACTLLQRSFAQALADVRDWLWHTLRNGATGQPLADLALAWDLHFARPHGPEEVGIVSLQGPSAGAAMAVAAARLLAHAAPPELAPLLDRLTPDALRHTWVTAALWPAEARTGRLAPVGGAGAKRGTLALLLAALADGAGAAGAGVSCVHVAEGQSQQPDDPPPRGAAPLQEHANLPALLEFLARSAEPPDAVADALLRQLLGDDERPAVPENTLAYVAQRMPTPTLARWLLKSWAHWAGRDAGQVHARHVPLAVQPDARGWRHGPVEPLAAAPRTLQSLLHDYDATGHHAYVLRGRPGAGKTTLLRHHQMTLCRQALRQLAGAGPLGAAHTTWREAPSTAPVELPLYLPLATLQAGDDPVQWARLRLRKDGAPRAVLDWLDPDTPRPPGQCLRLMLDGINELPVDTQRHELREERAAEVVRALRTVLAGPLAQGLPGGGAPAPLLPLLLSIRQHHADGLPGIDLLRVDVQDWDAAGVREYLALRLPAPSPAPGHPPRRDEDSPWWAHWQALNEPRHRAALALCRVPLNLAGQCELWAHGFEATLTNRAALYTAWLWLRLRRALGHAVASGEALTPEAAAAAKARGEAWREAGLLTERDCKRIGSATAWRDPHPDALPCEGLLLDRLIAQAERQYWTDAQASRSAAQRCARVDVPLAEVAPELVDADLRRRWLAAVAELGLAEVAEPDGPPPAAHAPSTTHQPATGPLFGFAHQSWGEYLASVRLLDAEPPDWVPGLRRNGGLGRWRAAPAVALSPKLARLLSACEAARRPGPGTRGDAEEIAYLNTHGSPAWERALPRLLPFADPDHRLPVAVDAMLADRYTGKLDTPQERDRWIDQWQRADAPWFTARIFELDPARQTCHISLRIWGDSTAADDILCTGRRGAWAQRSAGWQYLAHDRLRLAVRQALWQALGAPPDAGSAPALDADTLQALREQPARLHTPPTGDVDEVLSLAVAGLRQPADWLAWWLAAGHGARLAPALAALQARLEPETAAPAAMADTAGAHTPRRAWHQPDLVLQHWRRVLLLHSLDAGRHALRRLRASGLWATLHAPLAGLPPLLQAHWQQECATAWQGRGRDLRLRARAAELLGELGDTLRYEPPPQTAAAGPVAASAGRPELAPAPAPTAHALRLHAALWVPMGRMGEPTRFRIGAPLWRADRSERPVFTHSLPGFEAAALPVTVAEWRCFIDAGGCDSADTPWWQAAGPAAQGWLRARLAERAGTGWRPGFWQQPGRNAPLQPATGITHWEALAYAHWATALYAGAPGPGGASPASGRWQLALPTELQWEALARGPAPPRWRAALALLAGPWGGQRSWPHRPGHRPPPALDFNHGATRWGWPMAVGLFTRSLSPQGLADVAGQVWEWCSSGLDRTARGRGWQRPEDRANAATTALQPQDGTLDVAERALRGGAFNDTTDNCRAAYRYHYHPDVHDGDVGVRLVRVWLPHSEP